MAGAGRAGLLARFLRAQFSPLMIAPVLLGTAAAWHFDSRFDLWLFALALAGSVLLHLAANGIDDVYDYSSGTDKVSAQMMPPDAPGWKPLARGMMTAREGMGVSFALYALSLAIAAYLSLVVGWYALAIAVPGILLSYFYVAPPLRLDYRGAGLGELSILVCFGPIPALGAFYVLTGHLSAVTAVAAVSSGTLTTGVLISHDMIFYDAYKASGKKTLTVVIGRGAAARLLTAMTALSYALVFSLVAGGWLPPASLLVVLALPLFLRFADVSGKERPPPDYGPRTMSAFFHTVLFTLLLALALLLG